MDWDKLKSFYEIAISKSISKASAKLNISQSALSRQIQDLEYDLKTPLFIRHQKGVRLTEQGENLFNTVSQINTSVSSFEKKLIDKIADNTVECISDGKDKYKRTLAECFVNNESLSSYLVRSGYAFAYRKYSTKFVLDEDFARVNKTGMWAMEFDYPWDYRKKN